MVLKGADVVETEWSRVPDQVSEKRARGRMCGQGQVDGEETFHFLQEKQVGAFPPSSDIAQTQESICYWSDLYCFLRSPELMSCSTIFNQLGC